MADIKGWDTGLRSNNGPLRLSISHFVESAIKKHWRCVGVRTWLIKQCFFKHKDPSVIPRAHRREKVGTQRWGNLDGWVGSLGSLACQPV